MVDFWHGYARGQLDGAIRRMAGRCELFHMWGVSVVVVAGRHECMAHQPGALDAPRRD